ncbi:MAG: zinc-binding dehydrogenase, partial [Gemmatimonadota bacterium]
MQLAANAGARVFATVGSAEKAALVRELGAHDAILYRETDFVQAVLDLTDGEGVDVVMDNVGGETLEKSAGATRCYGDLVTLLKAGPDVDLSLARMRNLRLGFEMVLTPLVFSLHDEQVRQRRILEQAREMFDTGKLRVIVSHALPLEQAAKAHRMIEAGG